MKTTQTSPLMSRILITNDADRNEAILTRVLETAPRLRPVSHPVKPHTILWDGTQFWKVLPPEPGQSPTLVLLVQSDAQGRPGLTHSLRSRCSLTSPQWMVVAEPFSVWGWLTEDRGVWGNDTLDPMYRLTRLQGLIAYGAMGLGCLVWWLFFSR